MRRRTFHRSLLALLAGAGPFAGAAACATRAASGDTRDLFFYLPDRGAVLALGRRCIEAGQRPASRRGFHARLEAAVAADFAAGRVVTVDGWVISETEARVAAALALAAAGR
jgi:hypothetical protein